MKNENRQPGCSLMPIELSAVANATYDVIKEMIRTAEQNREDDVVRRELAEARNELDGLLYTTERSLDEYGDAIPFEDLMAIREAITHCQTALKGNSVTGIRQAHEKLAQSAQTLADALYSGVMADADALADEMLASEAFDEGAAGDGEDAAPPAE